MLGAHDHVKDVAVIGAPDLRRGSACTLQVGATLTEEELPC
jgi:hypothetical protein